MKNERNSNNQKRRTETGRFTKSESGSESSNTVRADVGITTADTSENRSIREQSDNTINDDSTAERYNKQFTLTDGYYFTPNGDVERIPTGHYIHNGRLRKRRSRNNDDGNSTNGNINSDRTETSESNKYLEEIPLRIESKTRRATKKLSEKTAKLTMVTMIATGCSAIFTSVAMLTHHEHWQLEVAESQTLADALNNAFETLPAKYYAQITAIIEKWIPWINLAFVVGAIIIPRFEESQKRIETRNYQPSKVASSGNAAERTNDNPINGTNSLGWNIG